MPLKSDGLAHDTARLLIGDKVVTDAPPTDRYPHQMDLGEAWKDLTGLPFVYAMWMCRGPRTGDQARSKGTCFEGRRLQLALLDSDHGLGRSFRIC